MAVESIVRYLPWDSLSACLLLADSAVQDVGRPKLEESLMPGGKPRLPTDRAYRRVFG